MTNETFSKIKTIEEIPHHHQKDHRIVEEVTHIERFTDPICGKRKQNHTAGCPPNTHCSAEAKTWSRLGKMRLNSNVSGYQ